MSYITVQNFKGAIGVEDTVDDGFLQFVLDTATSAIDNFCGRVFTAQDTVASARVFDSACTGYGYPYGPGSPPYGWFFGTAWQYPGMDRLNVPDVASVTAVDLDLNLNGTFTTHLPSSAWQLYPLNVGTPAVVGNYTEIRLRPTAPYAFWPGYQIRVTGLWGWPSADSPPEPVAAACMMLANRYYRRPGAPFGLWEGPQMGQLAVMPNLDPDVAQLLTPYRASTQAPEWVLV